MRDSFNAVFVEGDAVGDLMFYGRGAGGDPTASAVLGDLIDAAVNLRKGTHASHRRARPGRASARSTTLESAYYLNLEVVDQPGVLAAVAGVFGATACRSARWSRRASATRPASSSSPTAPARPTCRPRSRDLRELDVVRPVGSVLRVVDDER